MPKPLIVLFHLRLKESEEVEEVQTDSVPEQDSQATQTFCSDPVGQLCEW